MALTVNGTVSSTCTATGTRPPSTMAVQLNFWNALTSRLGHDTELAGGLDGWTRNEFRIVFVTTRALAEIVVAAPAGAANTTTATVTTNPTPTRRRRIITKR